MFIPVVIQLVALLSGHSQLEIKLDLYRGDDKVGYGTFTESTERGGHRSRRIKLWAKDDAETRIKIDNTKVVDSNAFPISEREEVVRESASMRSVIICEVRYDKNGAAVYSEYKDKVLYTKRTFPPLPGSSRADASDLWFTKVLPSSGTTVHSTVFDIEYAKWREVETTYLGKKWITVNGRQVEANEVRDIRDNKVRTVYLDDKGQPVLMKNGDLRTEKHF